MPNEMVERCARAMANVPFHNGEQDYEELARAAIQTLLTPTEQQWDGLARQLIMWQDMSPKTPRALFSHLKASGYEIPQWLRDEPEMQSLDHVPSKGTRAVIIYQAMLRAALD